MSWDHIEELLARVVARQNAERDSALDDLRRRVAALETALDGERRLRELAVEIDRRLAEQGERLARAAGALELAGAALPDAPANGAAKRLKQ